MPRIVATVYHKGVLIPSAAWLFDKLEKLRVADEEVRAVVTSDAWWSSGYRADLTVDRRDVPRALLYAPVNFTRMAPVIEEAQRARVHVRLFDCRGDVVLDVVSKNTGLEVHGNVQSLADNICGKKTASRIDCL